MRNTSLLLSCLAVVLFATPSHAVVTESAVPIMLLTGSSVNKINIAATLVSEDTDTDSCTSTASGTLGGDFVYSFNGANLTSPTLKSLNINSGTFSLTPIDLDLTAYYWGFMSTNVDVTSNTLGGIVRTTSPPATVTNGTSFSASKQKATINSGTLAIKVFGVTVESINFATDNAYGTSSGTGTVTTTFLSKSGYDYTYKIHLEMPLKVTDSGTASNDIIGDVTYTLAATGTAVAEGTFTQTIIPGDANWDYVVDGSDATILAGYWQYGADMTVPDATWEMGDFNGDKIVDGSDATILAGYWQQSATPAAAVPEPGTIALLLSGMLAAGLAFIQRRR